MSYLCRDLSTKFHGQTATHFWQTGQYFGLVSLTYSSTQPSSLVLNQCIAAINKAVSSSTDSLQEALSASPNQAISPDYQIKTLILGAIQDSEIFLVSQGDARVVLSRFSQISQVLRSQNQEIQTTTGLLQTDDILLLCNQSYLATDLWNQTKQALATGNLDQAQIQLSNFSHQPKVATLIQIQNISITRPSSNKTKSKNFLLLLIPFFLIFAAFLFKQATNKLSYNQLHKQLDEELTTAEGLLPLNPVSAQEVSSKAKLTFDKITSIKQEDWQLDYARRLSRFTNQVLPTPTMADSDPTPSTDTQFGSLGSAQPWLDLKATNSLAHYNALSLFQDQLLLLDNTNKRLDKLSLSTKDISTFLKGSSLESTNLLASTSSGTFVANSSNLYKADTQGLTNLLKLSSSSLTVAPAQFSFWNNTLYVLDSESRNIFKYLPNQKSFDPPSPWLKPSTKLPIDTISFAIDTSIYTINKQGEISLYQKGEKQPFAIQNGPLPTNPHMILAPPGNNLIVLYQNQVATISKTGSVQKLYDLGDSQALQASFFNSILYILTEDQKIIKLAL